MAALLFGVRNWGREKKLLVVQLALAAGAGQWGWEEEKDRHGNMGIAWQLAAWAGLSHLS